MKHASVLRYGFAAGGLTLALLWQLTGTIRAEQPGAGDPQFTKDDELVRPANYREWIYLTSGLGMSYDPPSGAAANPRFDNVFVHPAAYRAFLASGKWPDKTMFILEVRTSASHGSINQAGHFQTGVAGIEAAVKDVARFKERWAYFSFDSGGVIQHTAKPFAGNSSCNACHSKNAAVDNTFVQFYPTLLEVARAKHTLNANFAEPASTRSAIVK